MRVELYSQKDHWLFVHIDHKSPPSDYDDEFDAWANDPLGWGESGLPSVATLLGQPIDPYGFDAIVFQDLGLDGDLAFGSFNDGVISVHMRHVDRFVRTMELDRSGHTLVAFDEVHLITGPVEGLTLADLSRWKSNRYAHWVRGVGSPRGPRGRGEPRRP